MKLRMDGEEYFFTALQWVSGLLIVCGFCCLMAIIFSSGEVDYCTVKATRVGAVVEYTLRGHVRWGEDHDMGLFGSFDEAVAAANKANCPVGQPTKLMEHVK